MVAWIAPGIIVAFRSVFEPDDRPHWTYTVAVGTVSGTRWLFDALTSAAGSTMTPGPSPTTASTSPNPTDPPQHQDHTLVPDEDRFTTTLENDVDTIDDFRT